MNERIRELREQAWTLVSNEERDRGEVYEAREQWERCDQKFAELVRADERQRVTNLLLDMHNKAAPYHKYYKHAAVELNRKAGEGEKK